MNPICRQARAHLITASVMGEVCKRKKPEHDGPLKMIIYPNVPQVLVICPVLWQHRSTREGFGYSESEGIGG